MPKVFKLQQLGNAIQQILNAVSGKAEQSELDAHTGDGKVHVSTTEKSRWNDTYTKTQVDERIEKGGKVKTVSVNGGDAVQPDEHGNIDIEVPTDLKDLNDDSMHRTVTDEEKSAWSGKQPAGDYATKTELAGGLDALAEGLAGKQGTINDLETIRSGAGKGATSVQGVKMEGDDEPLTPDGNGVVTVPQPVIPDAVTSVLANNELVLQTPDGQSVKGKVGVTTGADGLLHLTLTDEEGHTYSSPIAGLRVNGNALQYSNDGETWTTVQTFGKLAIKYVQASDPASGDEGDLALVGSTNAYVLKVYVGGSWVSVGDIGTLDLTSDGIKMAGENRTLTDFKNEVESQFLSDVLFSGTLTVGNIPQKVLLNLKVGKTYIFEIAFNTPLTASTAPYLYQTTGNNPNKQLSSALKAGDSSVRIEYTPESATNYQYFGIWSTANNSCTYSIREKTNLLERIGNVESVVEVLDDSSLFEATYNVNANTQYRYLLSPALEVGETYIFRVQLGSAASVGLGVFLYINDNVTVNTNKQIGGLKAGESSVEFEYTPVEGSNYQYLGFWTTVSQQGVVVSFRKKNLLDTVGKLDDRVEEIEGNMLVDGVTIYNSDVVWEQGNIRNTTGTDTPNSYIVRTKGFSVIDLKKCRVENNTSYYLALNLYHQDGRFIVQLNVGPNRTSEIDLSSRFDENEEYLNVRFVFWLDGTTITPSMAESLDWKLQCYDNQKDYLMELDDTTKGIKERLATEERLSVRYLTGMTIDNSNVEWEQGNIDGSTGQNTVDSNVPRTKDSFVVYDDFVVLNSTDVDVFLFLYRLDGTFIRLINGHHYSQGYAIKLSDLTDEEGVKIRLTFWKNGKTITPSDAEGYDWSIMVFPLMQQSGNYGDDYSDVEAVEIPIPQTLPHVNLIVPNLPTAKGSEISGYLEYKHELVYFKKPIILDAQGQSSMGYYQKNLAVDIDDGSKIKFGNWVAQDSFHLKCYYIDVLRGYNNIGFNYCEEVIRYKDCRANRNLAGATASNGSGTFDRDFDCALCHPDGFPVELYVNGEYYGLYVWNIKKHRDNYSMGKSNYEQIHLDGEIGPGTLFGGTIDWTKFEIRNPKKLILVDGTTEYDGDNPLEIIGSGSANYDADNKDHRNTAITKDAIIRLSHAVSVIRSESGADAKRQVFEQYFDVDMMLVYLVLGNVLDNYDGFYKNWQWLCYDGIWSPNFYDMDTLFGRHWTGAYVSRQPNVSIGLSSGNTLVGTFYELYETRIKALYAELRDNGMISTGHIMEYVYAWVDRIGSAAYKRNLTKWPQIPSYRADHPETNYTDGTATYGAADRGMYDSPARIRKWLDAHIVYLDTQMGYNS